MKFFNLDLHISVIKDVENILKSIFNNIEITNWSISGHNWVFNQATSNPEGINQHTWKNINEVLINRFNKEVDLSEYDGFIVTHTPVFALIFERYNKPIVCVNSCRYDQPFCWVHSERFQWLNDGLIRMVKKNQLIIISNNKADQEYLRLGTGIESEYIPSLCDYTNTKHNPTNPNMVLYGEFENFSKIEGIVQRPTSGYKWSSLYSYVAIVHNPYEISTMSIAEQITAGVPLFFPSKDFYKKSIQERSMILSSSYGNNIKTDIDFWLNNADFYNDYKFIYYYNSLEDLQGQIQKFDDSLSILHRQEWLRMRKNEIYFNWYSIMKRIINTAPQIRELTIFPQIKNTSEIITSDALYMYYVKNPTINYIKTDCINTNKNWRNNQHKDFNYRTVLITTHSDDEINDTLYEKYSPNCSVWFSNNVNTIQSNLIGLPLGVTNNEPNSPVHSIYSDSRQILIARKKSFDKKTLCYMNFNKSTYSGRKAIWDMLCNFEWIVKDNHEQSLNGRQSYLNKLAQSKFCICPRGNGIDTHRLWESLYVGTIPIVEKSIVHNGWTDLPILFIDNWSEINETFLEEKYVEMTSRIDWNLDKLKTSYWIRRIDEIIEKQCQNLLDVPDDVDCRLFINFNTLPETTNIQSLFESLLSKGVNNIELYSTSVNESMNPLFRSFFLELENFNCVRMNTYQGVPKLINLLPTNPMVIFHPRLAT